MIRCQLFDTRFLKRSKQVQMTILIWFRFQKTIYGVVNLKEEVLTVMVLLGDKKLAEPLKFQPWNKDTISYKKEAYFDYFRTLEILPFSVGDRFSCAPQKYFPLINFFKPREPHNRQHFFFYVHYSIYCFFGSKLNQNRHLLLFGPFRKSSIK